MNAEEASMGKAKRVKRKRHQWVVLTVAVLVAVGLGAGFLVSGGGGLSERGVPVGAPGDRFETLGPGDLPSFVAQADARLREAYRYAAANSEVLQYIPCYCGCGNIGHRHNGDCYVQERHADGRITFTSHAAT